VQGVDNAAAGAGVDLPLSETAGPAADQVDQTIQDTVDQVGGTVGQSGLGHQVGGAVDGLTNRVLPH
jgi:hypothetical protein